MLNAKNIKEILEKLAVIMKENREYLIELDAVIGDGDLGITMSKGFGKVAEDIIDYDEDDIGKVLLKAGMVMLQSVPSTMGTLMGSGFLKSGKLLMGKKELNLEGLADLFNGFAQGIMDRGKAKPGDKTVIDSLYPGAHALTNAVQNGEDIKTAITLAYDAAKSGLEKTIQMKSTFGKAACFQEKTIGKQDPGATVGMLIFQGVYEYIIHI